MVNSTIGDKAKTIAEDVFETALRPGFRVCDETLNNIFRQRHEESVTSCYGILNNWFLNSGYRDYTEGIYNNDPSTSYEEAQKNQINYLLDEVKCTKGTRVLDIGCGHGTLLEEVRNRGGIGVGITISPGQVKHCTEQGLDVRLLNYKDIGEEWNGQFDAVIANGSMEHFASLQEAIQGKSDEVYKEFFKICHRMIDPNSDSKRMATTVIHATRKVDPRKLLKSPFSFPLDSQYFHYAFISRIYGGWYPFEEQLKRCAKGSFNPLKTVDGTYDYHLTSETWLKGFKANLKKKKVLKIFLDSFPSMVKYPYHFLIAVVGIYIFESWHWQFRGPNPPTRLFRHTWERID
jgi:cyclopropane-fatty-acyl-phospholipid synthase